MAVQYRQGGGADSHAAAVSRPVSAPGVRGAAGRGRHHRPGAAGHRRPRNLRSGTQASGLAARSLARMSAWLLCGLAAAMFKEEALVRGFEAQLASHVVALAASVHTGALASSALIWFTATPTTQVDLQVTPECTVALLMIPFLLITAWAIWQRSRVARSLTALAVSLVLLIALNQLRILIIVSLVLRMGFSSGFYWGHTMIGSVLTVAGVMAVLVLYAFIVFRQRTAARA